MMPFVTVAGGKQVKGRLKEERVKVNQMAKVTIEHGRLKKVNLESAVGLIYYDFNRMILSFIAESSPEECLFHCIFKP